MHIGIVYALNAIVSLLLMAIIYGRIKLAAEQEAVEKTFTRMLVFCMMFCIVDAMWGLCYTGVIKGRGIFTAVGYCYHTLSGASAFVWMLYVIKFAQRQRLGLNILRSVGSLFLVCQLLIIFYNTTSPARFVFTVTADGTYTVGPLRSSLYYLQFAYYIMILITGVVMHIKADDDEEREWYRSGMIFSVVPLLFGIAQYVFFDVAMYSLGFAFTAAIIYMFRHTYRERAFVEGKHAEITHEQLSIIKALAGKFYAIYYVDEETGSYDRFTRPIDGSPGFVKLSARDKNFFDEALNYGRRMITEEDRENFMLAVTRENLMQQLSEKSLLSLVYKTIVNGGVRYCRYSMVRDLSGEKPHVILAIYDIDEEHRRKLRQQEKLRETLERKTALEQEAQMLDAVAHRDIMTGLFNRRAYEDHLHDFGGKPDSDDFVVISYDLNGLKAVNDDIGHEAGDELIKGAGICMKRCFGPYGRVYRHGGDEFSAMLHISPEELKKACAKFDAELADWRGQYVDGISVSYGSAFAKENPGASIEELEKAADKIMYENKMLHYARKGIDRRGQQEAYEVLRQSYIKVLKCDLKNDTFSIIKTNEHETGETEGYSDTLSAWLHGFAAAGNVHESDREEYLKRTNIAYLRSFFRDPGAIYMLRYRRRTGEHDTPSAAFRETMMEIMRAKDYSDEKQTVFLYVKQIDGGRLYMRLQDLPEDAELTVQITWEHDMMEFPSKLVRADSGGIYIEPKMHGDRPLRISVSASDNARCSLYAASATIGGRIVWHDAELMTVDDSAAEDAKTVYFVSTRLFNRYSRPGERRFSERSQSSIHALMTDAQGRQHDVLINDISGSGLSCSLIGTVPETPDLSEGCEAGISFIAAAGGDEFNIKESVGIVRRYTEHGRLCLGCRVINPSEEYRLYVFLAGMEKTR